MSKLFYFDIQSSDFQHDPYKYYEKIHKNNGIFYDERLNAYFIGKFCDVNKILLSKDFSTLPLAKRAEPVMGDRVLAQMEGYEHHSKRKLVISNLTRKLFSESYSEKIKNITMRLINEISNLKSFDLVREFGKDYSILVTLSILGLPFDNYKNILEWHKGIVLFITSFHLSKKEIEHSLDCSKNLIQYLTPIVEDKFKCPDDSFISKLCNYLDEERMTVSEIVALILNIILAATEPADKTLGYLFYYLLKERDLWDAILKDRTLLKDAINETLRIRSPVQLIPRQAMQEIYFGEVKIPKDALVFCMIGAANRDPNVFDYPDKFILNRKNLDINNLGKRTIHLAFGAGIHTCVGAIFSQMQIELTANILIDLFPKMKLSIDFSLTEEGIYTRGLTTLPIINDEDI